MTKNRQPLRPLLNNSITRKEWEIHFKQTHKVWLMSEIREVRKVIEASLFLDSTEIHDLMLIYFEILMTELYTFKTDSHEN